jgi:UbiD family decarboxylase
VASLSGFLEEVGFEEVGEPLEPRFGVARLLYETQWRGVPQVFKVKGYDFVAAGNVVASRRLILRSLSASSDEEAYRRLLEALGSPGPLSIEGTPNLEEVGGFLAGLPAVNFYEGEGGPYITSGVFIACYDDVCNASIHRLMVLGPREAVARLVPRHLYRLYKTARSRGEDLPVSIVIGVHPAVLLASASSPRLGVFELGVAKTLLPSLRVVESPIHRLPVPYPFSALIEARITGIEAEEGPFVDATGTLDRVRRQPLIRVDGVYKAGEPFHIILPAGLEHANLMGFPREAQIWEAVSRVVSRVHAVRLTPSSGGWLHAVIAIEKLHDGDAKNAIMAAFAAHPSLKHVVVVDPDIDVDDPRDVEWAIATRFQADRDLVVIRGARGSTLDPSAKEGLTSKMGLDATVPLGSEVKFQRARIPHVE